MTTEPVRTGVMWLDDPAAGEVAVAGAKAAGLARARAAGLPVLDGFVVPASWSAGALETGRAALGTGGSGAARLAVIRGPLALGMEHGVAAAAARLPEPLMARSSSVLEGSGEWSGAFTSLAEVRRDELPKAIRSVWAAVFSLDVLDRGEEAGIEPGSAPIAVLVQPEITPDYGGVAVVDPSSGAVTIDAVRGSPRDLVAGWAPGVRAVVADGAPTGEAVMLLGDRRVAGVADLARQAHAELGHNLVEWAVCDGRPVLLQVQHSAPAPPTPSVLCTGSPCMQGDPVHRTEEVARLVAMYDGMATPRGSKRRGRDRLEMQLAGVCAQQGTVISGRAAVGGFGAGRLVWVDSPTRTDHVRSRDVVVAQYPLANYSPLLWDAAGVVTVGGSPGAHLFEVARSLGVPAVVDCPIADVVRGASVLGLVDGDAGHVAILR